MANYDLVVIGAGAVGLSTAWAYKKRNTEHKVLVVEKEAGTGHHQTGHNSGVIHSGIYYRPGSLKAKLCQAGTASLVKFCEEHSVEYDICGKLIVACDESELGELEKLADRGLENGLNGILRLTPEECREREPHVRALRGLWVPQTGRVDYKTVFEVMQKELEKQGVEFSFNSKVTGVKSLSSSETIIRTEAGEFFAKKMVNCAGLYSDRLSKTHKGHRIIPFRGEFFSLSEEKSHLIKGLVYPVPNPELPFLGVHFTRTLSGTVKAGPNAVLAFGREAYTWGDFNGRETGWTLTWPGFYKMAMKYWKVGAQEMYRSLSRQAFANTLHKMVPEVEAKDIKPYGSGVRAQAIDNQGRLVDDFVIHREGNATHVLNAPSPAATASFAIGDEIAGALV